MEMVTSAILPVPVNRQPHPHRAITPLYPIRLVLHTERLALFPISECGVISIHQFIAIGTTSYELNGTCKKIYVYKMHHRYSRQFLYLYNVSNRRFRAAIWLVWYWY